MRLIDADKLRKHEKSVNDGNVTWLMDVYLPEEIDNAPTIQAVPIEVLDKIRADIEMYEADCILADDSKECKECDKIVFGSIYQIIEKYRREQE